MREIQLTKGAVALVDDDDYERINRHKWCLGGKYAIRREGPRPGYIVYMAREVMNSLNGTFDHINQNPLDNRKENLRPANKATNSMNRGLQSNSTSGYKGVSWCQSKWQAYIKFNGKKINLGTYFTKEAAAHAYDNKARELFGEFAVLNNAPTNSSEAILSSL